MSGFRPAGCLATIGRTALLLALAGLVAATLATFLARMGWVFDGFTHFRAQYAVCGLLLATGFGLLRSRWAALALLVALWQGWVWWDVAATPRAADCVARRLSIVGFNLEWSNPHRAEAVVALRGFSADLVMVAENWRDWAPDLERLAADFPYRTPSAWRDGDRPTLLSKLPILEAETVWPFARQIIEDPLLAHAATAFSYERALVDLGGGARVTIFAVHAPYPLGADVAALRDLYLARLALSLALVEGPAILIGDFNVAPWSPHYLDLVETAHLTSASGGHFPTWPVWSPLLRVPIDHLLVRGDVTVLDAHRGRDLGSDHFPVLATLCIADPR